MSAVIADAFRIETRSQTTKSALRAQRLAGKVPGVVYGANKENTMVSVDVRDIEKGLHQTNFYTSLYEVNLGKSPERVMVKEVHYHPVTDVPTHIDFLRVAKGTRLHVKVNITFKNEASSPGLKHGGILNVVLHGLDVTCDVDNIPDHIEVDLAGLNIGDTIHTDTLSLGKGVTLTHPERDVTVATIVAPSASNDSTDAQAPAESAPKA
jgi:large subunit ribosomal protein L25